MTKNNGFKFYSRLLGYKLMESRKAAMLASVEFNFNTASSPLLGSGKNVVSPVLVHSIRILERKTILAFSVSQFYSLWGDETRNNISSTKQQGYYVKAWSKRVWALLLPEIYFDHLQGGVSMNLESTAHYRLTGRVTFG